MGNDININVKEFKILYQEDNDFAMWFGFCGWRYGQVMGCCEHGDELSGP
jgi:hypothetical protein